MKDPALMLVPVLALTIWGLPITSGVVEVSGVTAFFVTLWVASGLLSRQAADPKSKFPGEKRGRGQSRAGVPD